MYMKKATLRLKNSFKLPRVLVVLVVVIYLKFLRSKQHEEKILIKKGRCKNKHCSSMSNSAWCDLNSKGNILKLLDKCRNPKCNCQKITTITPHQYMFEGGSIKSKLKNFSEEPKQRGICF